jgi:ribosomal protein S18 acetylase RimI-like enzyme
VSLRIESDPDPADLERIDDGIRAAAAHVTDIPPETDLAVFAREDGQIFGGVYGWTWGDCCELVGLWVDDAQRGRGIGTALMLMAEDEARARGCRQIVIFVHTFQPQALYERLGYTEIGRVTDFPAGSDAVWMLKRLTAP